MTLDTHDPGGKVRLPLMPGVKGDATFSADARYHVNPALSAAIGYAQDTELDGAFLNVRYNFR